MNFTFPEGADQCAEGFWMIPPDEWFDGAGAGTSGIGYLSMSFMRKGFVESDLLTLGVEAILAAEPRDDTWAEEAEKSLLSAAKRNSAESYNEGCEPQGVPKCRSVTCRVMLPIAQQGNCTANHYFGAWPSIGNHLTASARSADGKSRTYYLVREGFVFADVLTASK